MTETSPWTQTSPADRSDLIRQEASLRFGDHDWELSALRAATGASWTVFCDGTLSGSGLATDLEAARNAAERHIAPGGTRLAALRQALGRGKG